MFEEDLLEERRAACRGNPAGDDLGIPFFIIVPVFVLCLEIEMIMGLKMACVLDPPIVLIAVAIVKHDYNGPRLWWSGSPRGR